MIDIDSLNNKKIALYGLGTETERFLLNHGRALKIIGLLDGFLTEGELYGCPIISMQQAIDMGINMIIVIARPGSCKAIVKRIGSTCTMHDIELFDVRGKDLLALVKVSYDFAGVHGGNTRELLNAIDESEVVSFDLFDTLVIRKVYSYTDIFELVDVELKKQGVEIPAFSARRISAEKELSKAGAPRLRAIYEYLLDKADLADSKITPEELSLLEWNIDSSLMMPRQRVCEMLRAAVDQGKTLIITTDSYYNEEQIKELLQKMYIGGYKKVFVSSEYDTSKGQKLFDVVKSDFDGRRILHIGDDEVADIKAASEHNIDSFKLFSGMQLFDSLGGLGLEEHIESLSDRVKVGLFISGLFNNPFWFEGEENRLSVGNAKELGYLFCAPMITDFVMWLKRRLNSEKYRQVLFGARDGYLVEQLYKLVDVDTRSLYFVTSRIAAIRAGVESDDDIEYVASMKYFGSAEEELQTRYGIEVDDVDSVDKNALILEKTQKQRANYNKYIKELGVDDGELAMFDFVAKGTSQMFLQRLFTQRMKGFYFMQLEPEFMRDKGIDIEPFYSDEERDFSSVFENYYILETILTAPYPQMLEMDSNGNPVYMEETRSKRDIACFERAQEGIRDFFSDYISILPEDFRSENKKLDEEFLSLINKVQISDEDFMRMKVEDPFFGRMTDMKDVIG